MTYEELPQTLPIFPLHGVLLLPGGNLPLNIFEKRYLAMFDDALRDNRLIGIIQPRVTGAPELYSVGCAGRITAFEETPDGRYEIKLKGISRFRFEDELEQVSGYRRVAPMWDEFGDDTDQEKKCLGVKREKLKKLLKKYFEREGMNCDWQAVDEVGDGKLMTCLSMTCPFEPVEKQALLEEKCCKKRSEMFMTLLEMEVCK